MPNSKPINSNPLPQACCQSIVALTFGGIACWTVFHSGKNTFITRMLNVFKNSNTNSHQNISLISMLAATLFGLNASWNFYSYFSMGSRDIELIEPKKNKLSSQQIEKSQDIEPVVSEKSTLSFRSLQNKKKNQFYNAPLTDEPKSHTNPSRIRHLMNSNLQEKSSFQGSSPTQEDNKILQNKLAKTSAKLSKQFQKIEKLEKTIESLNSQLKKASSKTAQAPNEKQETTPSIEQQTSTTPETELLKQKIQSLELQIKKINTEARKAPEDGKDNQELQKQLEAVIQQLEKSQENYEQAYNLAKKQEDKIEDMQQYAAVAKKKLTELTKNMGSEHAAIQTISLPATNHPFYQLILSLNEAIHTQNSHGCEHSLQSTNSPIFSRKPTKANSNKTQP